MDLKEAVRKIHWLGNDAVRIDGSTVVLIDPYGISVTKAADLVLLSHDHVDHNLAEVVARVRKEDSVIVTDGASGQKLQGEVEAISLGYGINRVLSKEFNGQVKVVVPGDKLHLKGVEIEIGPACGLNRDFNPGAGDALSFLLTLDGVSYYHNAADIDLAPEMSALNVDIAFVPLSDNHVVTAVQAAKRINPKIAVPIRYGDSSEKRAKEFEKALEGRIEVVILQHEKIMLIGGG